MTTHPYSAHQNTVVLRGRLAALEEPKEMPSGDVLLAFRVIVERPPAPSPRRSDGRSGRTAVDTIECQAVRRRVQAALARSSPGDLVEVEGSLRRRFWRGPAGVASRYSVEAVRVRRVRS